MKAFSLPRPSFRQLLVVAFLLVATLLGGVALRGQLTLEGLLERSRAENQRTLRLSSHAERLGEATLTMERAARQYLVLGDPTLRQTYERNAAEAAGHVQALAAGAVAPEATRAWLAQRAQIDRELREAEFVPGSRDRALAAAFRELGVQQARMGEQLRRVTEARNAALQAELDAGRAALGRLVAGATVLTLSLALGLALLLARPLRRVEMAIVALGENRLDERIDIRGPSDVRQIGRRLDWLRQRLAGIDADKARFLRHVSHELKTPLAALREGVALLQDGVAGPLSDNQREVARILHDNTATLQRRIEDLLKFNAAAFAAERLVRKPTDMGALVAGLVQEQQLVWRARRLHVQVRCHPAAEGAPLVADVDAELLGSALGNLLSNAIRYSPEGGTVTLTLQQQGDGLTIDVQDQGPGVPAAERERIFEPFFRGAQQPADGLPGTGIGLSIVAEAVAAHGGRVQLLGSPAAETGGGEATTTDSQAPHEPGAHFRITLPHALAD
ncbi:ATP-binding protein [Rubrivivax rivuli]|uniref:Signal transduction histidine-protein kinase/phosphatase MprB n=1 Tax=Rubrivivax rivuli TaxID=1862385 RepID=A0A437REZ1_9BURK|nr:ATP-binding protein [Rubrivivax rivuli]RVU45284.1 two-component sensor histidine kinase [Rubrivivax rivuli]